jgi:hypothetical protein
VNEKLRVKIKTSKKAMSFEIKIKELGFEVKDNKDGQTVTKV